MNNNGLIYDLHDKPKFNQLLIFALQQVLAIMAATIAVPKIIGLPTQIPAALLGAGIGTIVYLLFTKFKSPVFLGSSFAFLNSLFVALSYGYLGIISGSVLAGLVYVIIAVVIHFVGTNWINKLMPPVVIGPTVAIIGLSLAGNAMGDMTSLSGVSFVTEGDNISNYNLVAVLCGLATFFTVVICSTQKKYKMMKLIPFVIGIAVGYLLATVFTAIGKIANIDYLKIIDWSPIVNNFNYGAYEGAERVKVIVTSFINYPDFALIEGVKEIVTGEGRTFAGAQLLNMSSFVEIAIAFVPVALVVFAEHIADHKNLGSIIGRDLITDPGLEKTLLGDGVGSIAGTVFGVCPNTTYGESVGCVAITKNASIRTIFTAAVMCIILAFFVPVMVLLQTIPACVMGGVCLALYGFIAVSGLRMLKDVDLNDNKNLFVVAVILISGIGGLALKIPYKFNGVEIAKTITVTNIATALILGIITNFLVNKIDKPEKKAE
ncbi:MAG: uracil-xanthine permease family protein [Christensenellaceae bacterium]